MSPAHEAPFDAERPAQRPTRREARHVVRLSALVAVLAVVLALVPRTGDAAMSPAEAATAAWLAAQVGPDGAVSIPTETFGTTSQTMFVALGLAATGEGSPALDRTMGWISTHVDDWVVNDGTGSTVAAVGTDLPGRLGQLLLLIAAVGGDPRAFGTPSTDLVARLQSLLGISQPGVYGWPDPYSAVTDQSYAILGLVATGVTVPSAAVQWLVDQQCPAGGASGTDGGWEALRGVTGGVLDPCTTPDPLAYTGPDTNATAMAVQALVATATTAPVAPALAFLHTAQSQSGAAAGGFPWFTGGDADPNSTSFAIQAIVAAGEDPASPTWAVAGATPTSVLRTWQLTGADAGAFEFPYPGMYGLPNLLATYQGMWGLAAAAFPFPRVTTSTTAPVEVAPRHAG